MTAVHDALAALSAVKAQLRLERKERRSVQLELRNERAQRQAAQNALAAARAQLESQRELIQQLQQDYRDALDRGQQDYRAALDQGRQDYRVALDQERRTSRILEQQLSRTQDQLTTAQDQLARQTTMAHDEFTAAQQQVTAMQASLTSTMQGLHMTQAQLTASISLNHKLVDAAMLCGIASLSKKKKIRTSMPGPGRSMAAILARGEEDDSQRAAGANVDVSSGMPEEVRAVAKHGNSILKKRRMEATV